MLTIMSASVDASRSPFIAHMAIEIDAANGVTPGHSHRVLTLVGMDTARTLTQKLAMQHTYRTTHADSGMICGVKAITIQVR